MPPPLPQSTHHPIYGFIPLPEPFQRGVTPKGRLFMSIEQTLDATPPSTKSLGPDSREKIHLKNRLKTVVKVRLSSDKMGPIQHWNSHSNSNSIRQKLLENPLELY